MALHGRTETVEAILHYLAPEQQLHLFSLCDKDGQTALQLAGNNDHHQLMIMFQERAKQHVSEKTYGKILFFTFVWHLSIAVNTWKLTYTLPIQF